VRFTLAYRARRSRRARAALRARAPTRYRHRATSTGAPTCEPPGSRAFPTDGRRLRGTCRYRDVHYLKAPRISSVWTAGVADENWARAAGRSVVWHVRYRVRQGLSASSLVDHHRCLTPATWPFLVLPTMPFTSIACQPPTTHFLPSFILSLSITVQPCMHTHCWVLLPYFDTPAGHLTLLPHPHPTPYSQWDLWDFRHTTRTHTPTPCTLPRTPPQTPHTCTAPHPTPTPTHTHPHLHVSPYCFNPILLPCGHASL